MEWTVRAPMASTIVEVTAVPGAAVRAGEPLVIVEAMKMEHELRAAADARIAAVLVQAGDAVDEGDVLVQLKPLAATAHEGSSGPAAPANAAVAAEPLAARDPEIRADLLELQQRLALTTDERRPEAVARRRAMGQRTARENIESLCDPGSFIEYGALAYAAQRSRRALDDLTRNTPADGMVT